MLSPVLLHLPVFFDDKLCFWMPIPDRSMMPTVTNPESSSVSRNAAVGISCRVLELLRRLQGPESQLVMSNQQYYQPA